MGQSTPIYVGCRPCRTCKKVKLLSEFSRRARNGHRLDCKQCVATARAGGPPLAPLAGQSGKKTCIKCGEMKPVTAYGSRGDGRVRNDCKDCVAAVSKARYQSDPTVRARHKVLRDRWRNENPAYLAEYYQANRETAIANAIEYARRNPPDPDQVRRWARERYAADPEKHRAKDREWRQNNLERAREVGRRAQSRRRAQLRGLPFEDYTLDQILERDGSLCVLCDEEMDLTAEHPDLLAATVEHLECISWPGSAGDVLSNVAAAHFTCNSSRNNRPHPAAARKRAELLAAERAAVAG